MQSKSKGEMMKDEYVEVFEPAAHSSKAMETRAVPVVAIEADIEFHVRLANWRNTVRGLHGRAGGSGGFCASWAQHYVQQRDAAARERLIKQLGELPTVAASGRAMVSVDELDGWLVEAAVRSLQDYNERRVLQFWHVWQYPEHWIKTKLMLRRGGVKLVLARAQANLKNVLRDVNSAANILSNNLHAGVDPRPESNDEPVRASFALKKAQALVD